MGKQGEKHIMNQYLFHQVRGIANTNTQNGRIRHSLFQEIRNQNTVKAALIKLGYTPDCAASPTVWVYGKSQTVEAVQPIDKRKSVPPSVPLSVQLRQRLMAGEEIVINEYPLWRKYVLSVINDVKRSGHKVVETLGEKREIVSVQVVDKRHKLYRKPTAGTIADVVLKKLNEHGRIDPTDFNGKPSYLPTIISRLRASGMPIKSMKEGKRTVRYVVVQ